MSGSEPARISDGGEHTRSFKHRDIKDAFSPLNPTESFSVAARYSDISANWEAGLDVFASSIQKSIAGAWEGSAATAARDSISRYVSAANDLTDPLTQLGSRVYDAAEGILSTKSAIPEVPNEKPWWHKDSWPWVGIARDSVIKDRSETAQDAMRDYYVKPFVSLDSHPGPSQADKPKPSLGYCWAAGTTDRNQLWSAASSNAGYRSGHSRYQPGRSEPASHSG
ncbi:MULTISPECIES: WXG100 family type VII secretion target [unclassified Nocardia]|uniref:WXG100 family type VII secretion target n=1 Tax=unclassified Nocardia TaxID=2637762 RepID=UPI001CE424C3|nr:MULTISPECIES: WXG100 family type VII secretion target [unclassified Nocardia]